MHHALRKGPLFTKKHPLHFPLFLHKKPFSTFITSHFQLFYKTPPFSTFYKKTPTPFHFLPTRLKFNAQHVV